MIAEIIGILFLNSLVCVGVHESVQFDSEKVYDVEKLEWTETIKDKMIFWFVKFYGDKHLSIWLRKPLYDCHICMASIWSLPVIPIYLILSPWSPWLILLYPLYILALAGMNTIINGIVIKLYE